MGDLPISASIDGLEPACPPDQKSENDRNCPACANVPTASARDGPIRRGNCYFMDEVSFPGNRLRPEGIPGAGAAVRFCSPDRQGG